MQEVKSLEGKVALVTGAGRGIGRAIAIGLHRLGATVILNVNRSVEEAQKVQEEILTDGGRAEVVACDVADFDACGQMVKEIVDKYGKIDILVNNAGITRDNLLVRMTEEEYDAVLDTNLKGTFHTMRYVSKYMLKQRGGRIINITSVSGVLGNPGQANYSASKAGVIGLTKSAARELAARGICVNAVAPGFIDTAMTQKMSEKVISQALENIPLGRMGRPEEIAQTVAFLAGEGGAYITGQVICVDGGMAI